MLANTTISKQKQISFASKLLHDFACSLHVWNKIHVNHNLINLPTQISNSYMQFAVQTIVASKTALPLPMEAFSHKLSKYMNSKPKALSRYCIMHQKATTIHTSSWLHFQTNQSHTTFISRRNKASDAGTLHKGSRKIQPCFNLKAGPTKKQ